MNAVAVLSCLLALAWLPIAWKFHSFWKSRKNPVSLAICAAALLYAYTNILFAFALNGQASWQFFGNATHVFDLIVVVNFYIAFRWSDKKFVGARRGDHIPTSEQPPPA